MITNTDITWKQFFIDLSRHIDSQVSLSGHHSAHVADWGRATALRLAMNPKDIHAVYWAALLHDIGKLSVPPNVLSKRGPLTNDEWVLMKLHPIIGANIVKTHKDLSPLAPFIYWHQEKFDGSGYPDGLCGTQIPLGARILAVADAYEAMTHDRVYQKARSHKLAARELIVSVGQHFDPLVVEAFLRAIDLGKRLTSRQN
jgi:HD-GYP domain-containing protein (c-di-GMP phosphodiesterase class II)